MDSLAWGEESLSPVMPEPNILSTWMKTNNDQHFMLLFIFSIYVGPDLKEENPKKSVLQRISERLLPYTSNQLAGSYIHTAELENLYRYVLRNADQSIRMKISLLRQFLKGNLSIPVQDTSAKHCQFIDIFPTNLHRQGLYRNRKIIENITIIMNPEISYIKQEDIERFKRLSRQDDLLLHSDAMLHLKVQDVQGKGELPSVDCSRGSRKRKQANKPLEPPLDNLSPLSIVPYVPTLEHNHVASQLAAEQTMPEQRIGPAMLLLPNHPTTREWENIVAASRSGIGLTGSAAERQAGPIIGLFDIGVCEDAYLFRMSLPGVKNNAREFSCEVDSDGMVTIRGITSTGERRVRSHSLVFEMQTQNLCPPGPFSISFQLPGAVEPREFSGSFEANGIFEAILKKRPTTTRV